VIPEVRPTGSLLFNIPCDKRAKVACGFFLKDRICTKFGVEVSVGKDAIPGSSPPSVTVTISGGPDPDSRQMARATIEQRINAIPHPLYPWAGVDATYKSAAFVRGKLEVLRPLVQHFNPNNHHAIKDGIGALVLIRLRPGCVARFCREGSLQSDFYITGQFPLQMSGDIYICKGDGVIQEVEVGTVISPSSATTIPMIGDTGGGQIFQEELKRLAGEGTDEYVLGVWYKPSDKNPIGDIQPYISETADSAYESWTDIIFRGLQEEAQITLSDARRGELAGNSKGPFGYSRDKITDLATRVLHVVEIPILHGLRTDYTIHADASRLAGGGGQQAVEVKVEKIPPAAETTRMTVSSVADNEESEAGHRAADTAVPKKVDKKRADILTNSATERSDISAGISEESSRANATSHIPI
jgi:hypothetical protein